MVKNEEKNSGQATPNPETEKDMKEEKTELKEGEDTKTEEDKLVALKKAVKEEEDKLAALKGDNGRKKIPAATTKTMRVVATKLGIFGLERKYPGDEFVLREVKTVDEKTLPPEHFFSKNWMRKVSDPESASEKEYKASKKDTSQPRHPKAISEVTRPATTMP